MLGDHSQQVSVPLSLPRAVIYRPVLAGCLFAMTVVVQHRPGHPQVASSIGAWVMVFADEALERILATKLVSTGSLR